MRYKHYDDLAALAEQKLISVRQHPSLPLFIYNYTAAAQAIPIHAWGDALQDCRGLILDSSGEVVGRPFKKFWNYEQVLDQIPSDLPFTIWEKLDGSLGIICNYRGSLVVATRGSFESEQAKFASAWLAEQLPGWVPLEGLTYLAEIIYPENRIVVDYGDTKALKLLAVMEADGKESLATFYAEKWDKARGYPPYVVFTDRGALSVSQMENEEGYVVRWANGFRAKVKFEEYKRLHRLITQVSTRSIWELLRAGKPTDELFERVPMTFRSWASAMITKLNGEWNNIYLTAKHERDAALKVSTTRKEFAIAAKSCHFPNVMFALYDDKDVKDMIWRLIEPKWATPFRPGVEE